jgi:hypothetical protein
MGNPPFEPIAAAHKAIGYVDAAGGIHQENPGQVGNTVVQDFRRVAHRDATTAQGFQVEGGQSHAHAGEYLQIGQGVGELAVCAVSGVRSKRFHALAMLLQELVLLRAWGRQYLRVVLGLQSSL